MKVLYAAYRHDPCNPDLASGADYQFYRALVKNNVDVRFIGPFIKPAFILERGLRKLYRRWTNKRYLKFDLTNAWRASKELERIDRIWKPNVIFMLFFPSLVFYRGNTPAVFRLDTTFKGQQKDHPLYGQWALNVSVWQEQQAFQKCAKLITHSVWSKQNMQEEYGVDPQKIVVMPNPAALPKHIIPPAKMVKPMPLKYPLKLLLVGRDYHRKGIDIAIEVTHRLNQNGVPTELTICGLHGKGDQYCHFTGRFQKSDPKQLKAYTQLYQAAHFLLHPARFDPSPIVTSEAAAFGLPTLTNNVGGLATSVKDGESGIVLPKHSPPEAYIRVIREYLENPERYYDLCRTTRQRYERELNWDVAGKRVVSILEDVVKEHNA